MAGSAPELQAYLAPGESVERAVSGTMFHGTSRVEGTVGVTDRRILFVAPGGEFVDVAHGAIGSLQSHPRVPMTAARTRSWLLGLVGGLVAVGGFGAMVVLQPDALAVVLSLLTLGGVAVAEAVRRRGVDVEWRTLAAAWEAVRTDGGAPVEELRNRPLVRRPGTDDESNDPLVLGIGVVSLFALIALVAHSGTLLVVPLAIAAVGGLAVVDVAHRRATSGDSAGGPRRVERDVSIHLVDGGRVDLRVNGSKRIVRDISGLARNGTKPRPELPRGRA